MAETLGPKGMVSVPRCSQISEGYLTCAPGVKQAATDRVNTSIRNWGTLTLLDPRRGAKMPARGTEGGGAVVVKGPAVMAGTGRRAPGKDT
jgi:hypothetical protein